MQVPRPPAFRHLDGDKTAEATFTQYLVKVVYAFGPTGNPTDSVYANTINEAYNKRGAADYPNITIYSRDSLPPGPADMNASRNVILSGGCGPDFVEVPGAFTTLSSLVISGGTVSINSIIIGN